MLLKVQCGYKNSKWLLKVLSTCTCIFSSLFLYLEIQGNSFSGIYQILATNLIIQHQARQYLGIFITS